MKALKYMSVLALAVGMAACSQYEEPNPTIPVTPQEKIINAAGVEMTPSQYVEPQDTALATIDLASYTKLGFNVQMANVKIDTNEFPASYTFVPKMWLASDADFTKQVNVPCTLANGVVTATPADLQAAFEQLFGRKKDAQDVWVRYAGYAQNANVSDLRINGSDYWYATTNFKLAPVPPSFVVEDAYYLLGTVNGWAVNTAIKLTHSGKDVYDDPNFYGVFDITEAQAVDGWWWKIVPQSTYETGNWSDKPDSAFGVEENGDTALSGKLVGKTADKDPGAGCIKQAGKYLFHINLETLTYEFTPAYNSIDVTGNPTWNPENPLGVLQSALSDANEFTYVSYEGFAYVDGEFKFTTGGSWSTNWGKGQNAGTLIFNGSTNFGGFKTGIHYMKVSPSALTYEVGEKVITSWGMIGSFKESASWSKEVTMVSTDNKVWKTPVKVTLAEGDEFKFRANDSWDVTDIGAAGSTEYLKVKGDNIKVTKAGSYTVVLDMSKAPYSVRYE